VLQCCSVADRGLRYPLHHHPLDPVPGIPRRHRRFKYGWKHSQAFARPVPAHRGGRRCCHRRRCGARAAANGIVEIAGPERAPFNEIVARYLKAVGDPREVVRDAEARYFGGRVELREQGEALRAALAALTRGERQAIEMTFFAGLTHAEAAARLNQPLGTIKTRIRSGLHKLRQTLTAEMGKS
jgi:DNA-directed RNA polymerase specialized sigma24 family protein